MMVLLENECSFSGGDNEPLIAVNKDFEHFAP